MDYIFDGITEAFKLLLSFNEETYSAIFATLQISTISIIISLFIGLPLGFLIGYKNFFGKTQIKTFIDTLLALPTVVVGLLVYTFISRRGPFGELNLLFNISGIVIAQIILILPIIISLTSTAIESLDSRLKPTLITLGATKKGILLTTLSEARFAIFAASVTAYGRAISEVGISMMIGGNIKWHTRTITTAIALETGKGEFSTGIALGIVLISIAFFVNYSLSILKRFNQ